MAYLLSIVLAVIFLQSTCQASNLRWVKAAYGELPRYAVAGGADFPGEVLYVARIALNSGLTPGKFDVSASMAHASYGGREFYKHHYEVLTNPGWKSYLKWVPSSGSTPPANAVLGGTDAGRPLYVGRFMYSDGHMIPGKVAYFYRNAYIPFGGKEYVSGHFYVLVEETNVSFNRKKRIYPVVPGLKPMKRAPIIPSDDTSDE